MNKVLQEFIKKQQEESAQKKREEYDELKSKTLIKLGLVEKEYAPNDTIGEGYIEWDFDCNKYYKFVPIDITDEEFEELLKWLPAESKKEETTKKSGVAMILKVFAWIIYIGGFIAGFLLGTDRWGNPTLLTLVWWIVFLLVGTMYMGFAQILELLSEIKDNTKK